MKINLSTTYSAVVDHLCSLQTNNFKTFYRLSGRINKISKHQENSRAHFCEITKSLFSANNDTTPQ